MELYRRLENKKLRSMNQELSDYLWHEFHSGSLNDQDDFYVLFHDWIENAVIYTYDCEEILKGNSEYNYDEHELIGRPKNIAQAAYACLYDYLLDSPDTVTFDDISSSLSFPSIDGKRITKTI